METQKKSPKILLVDDDADDRKYFIDAAKEVDPDLTCVTAKDGREALMILKNFGTALPDFIFLDLRMPRVNGKQTLLQLKADPSLKDIPVILYTTSNEVEESEELLSLGAVRFITKPANTEEIYYVIAQVLEEQLGDKLYLGKPF